MIRKTLILAVVIWPLIGYGQSAGQINLSVTNGGVTESQNSLNQYETELSLDYGDPSTFERITTAQSQWQEETYGEALAMTTTATVAGPDLTEDWEFTDGTFSPNAAASASSAYTVTLNGPGSKPVPVLFAVNGNVNLELVGAADPDGSEYDPQMEVAAQSTVQSDIPGFGASNGEYTVSLNIDGRQGTNETQAFNQSGVLYLTPGVTYTVVDSDSASFDLESPFTNSDNPSATLTAFSDPSFEIDPSFAGASQYSLGYSYGTPPPLPVPEPSSFGLVGVGGVGLVGMLIRRRRRGLV